MDEDVKVDTCAIVTRSPALIEYVKKRYHLPIVATFDSPETMERYLGRFPNEIDFLYLDLDTAERPIKLLPFFDPVWWQGHKVEIFLVSESAEKLSDTKVHPKHFVIPPVIDHPH